MMSQKEKKARYYENLKLDAVRFAEYNEKKKLANAAYRNKQKQEFNTLSDAFKLKIKEASKVKRKLKKIENELSTTQNQNEELKLIVKQHQDEEESSPLTKRRFLEDYLKVDPTVVDHYEANNLLDPYFATMKGRADKLSLDSLDHQSIVAQIAAEDLADVGRRAEGSGYFAAENLLAFEARNNIFSKESLVQLTIETSANLTNVGDLSSKQNNLGKRESGLLWKKTTICQAGLDAVEGASDEYIKDVGVNAHPKNAKIDHRKIWYEILSNTDSLRKCAVTKDEFIQGLRPNPDDRILLKAGNDGTCCYNNSAGSQNTCTMIGHRSIINSLDIKIHNDSELQAPETPSASEGDSTNPYAGFNSEKLQFLVASSLVEDNQEEQFKAVGGIHGLFSDIQKLQSSVEYRSKFQNSRDSDILTPEPGYMEVNTIEADGITPVSLVFPIMSAIVCDLKALGMATGLGGGSSKTVFHCIWNPIRREEKGFSRGIFCNRCQLLNKDSCSHYGIYPSIKRKEIEMWPNDHPHLKYCFRMPETAEDCRSFLIHVDLIDPSFVASMDANRCLNETKHSFATNYVSPGIIRTWTVNSTIKSKTASEYVNWGLRVRNVRTVDELEYAFCLGINDGRLKNTIMSDFEKRKYTLLFLCEYGDEILYSRQNKSITGTPDHRTIWYVEAAPPDLLHMDLRVLNNIRFKMLNTLIELQEGDCSKRPNTLTSETKSKIESIYAIQTAKLGDKSLDATAHLKIEFVKGSLQEKDLDLSVLKIFFLENDIQKSIIDAIFLGKETFKRRGSENTLKQEWELLLGYLQQSHSLLHTKNKVSHDLAWEIQDVLDLFCAQFVKMFGGARVTNYIWIMMSGILVSFFTSYGNMRFLENQGFEATMGTVRTHIVTKTLHGGHTSGKVPGRKTTHGHALRKYMILGAIFKTQRITGNSALFESYRNKGKAARNARRKLTRGKQIKYPARPKVLFRMISDKTTVMETGKNGGHGTNCFRIVNKNVKSIPNILFTD